MSERWPPSAGSTTPRTSGVRPASLAIGSWGPRNWTASSSVQRRSPQRSTPSRRGRVWVSRGRRATLPISIVVAAIALIVAILIVAIITLILVVLLVVGLLWWGARVLALWGAWWSALTWIVSLVGHL